MGGRCAAADVAGLLVAIGRCWRRRGSAPRAGDDGPPRSSVRPPRHSPPHGDIDDDVAAAAAGRAARFSYRVIAKQAALKDRQALIICVNHILCPHARARGAAPIPTSSEAGRPARSARAGAAAADRRRHFFLAKLLLADSAAGTLALGIGTDADVGFAWSGGGAGAGAGRAQPATGSSATITKFCSTDSGGSLLRSAA